MKGPRATHFSAPNASSSKGIRTVGSTGFWAPVAGCSFSTACTVHLQLCAFTHVQVLETLHPAETMNPRAAAARVYRDMEALQAVRQSFAAAYVVIASIRCTRCSFWRDLSTLSTTIDASQNSTVTRSNKQTVFNVLGQPNQT